VLLNCESQVNNSLGGHCLKECVLDRYFKKKKNKGCDICMKIVAEITLMSDYVSRALNCGVDSLSICLCDFSE